MKDKSVYGFIVSEKPVESYFDYALTHDLHHLEFDLRKKHSRLNTFTPERIGRTREFTRLNGISLSLHPPFNINLCSTILAVRLYYKSYIRKCIRLAHQLNATHITLHLGNFHRLNNWADPRVLALDRLCKVLAQILADCEINGVTLALENVVPTRHEAGFSFLGDNINDFHNIFSQLKSRYLKFCLDVGHANTNEGPLEYVAQLGEKIVCVHIHDNKGIYDEHLDIGHGTVPWEGLMEALAKIDFRGPYISECFKTQPHAAIGRLKEYLP
ncbi:MAG TPA: sugar phosphate isomerase/epimerase family protein [Candidatus Deferrimicrobium sp.]|nr:sugar phosphate isomerase/epimerase family protein [Candidatus Deferrimicrobium sp.]